MKSVGRRTFLGLLGGAFAAISLPLQILDPFRSGRKLLAVPGGRILKRLHITLRSTIPGQPVISGINLASNDEVHVPLDARPTAFMVRETGLTNDQD